MKKELEKNIIYVFLSSKYKLLTSNTISRESNIPINEVIRFVNNSNLIVEAKKRTRRGEILYYLTETAKSLYKLEKRDFKKILQPVKDLLSTDNLNEAIQSFYLILKENKYNLNISLIEIYKEYLKSLSTKYYSIEQNWKLNKIDTHQRFLEHDKLFYDLFELLIGFELLGEETEQFLYQDISIKIERDFHKFTKDDSAKVLQEIAHLLNVNPSIITVKGIEQGSVIMTLELEDALQAEKLFLLIKLGKLKNKGIIDAKLKELVSGVGNEHQNNQLLSLCTKAISILKTGNTEDALKLLDENLLLISNDLHNELFLLYSDLSSLTSEMNLGIRDYESARITKNKITFSVLTLIDRIKKMATADMP